MSRRPPEVVLPASDGSGSTLPSRTCLANFGDARRRFQGEEERGGAGHVRGGHRGAVEEGVAARFAEPGGAVEVEVVDPDAVAGARTGAGFVAEGEIEDPAAAERFVEAVGEVPGAARRGTEVGFAVEVDFEPERPAADGAVELDLAVVEAGGHGESRSREERTEPASGEAPGESLIPKEVSGGSFVRPKPPSGPIAVHLGSRTGASKSWSTTSVTG